MLEPESVRLTAAPPRPTSQAPRPPHPSLSGREDAETAAVLPNDFDKALAKLQQQRQTGAPAPVAPTDPQQALAQLQRQREMGAPAPPPPPSRPLVNGTGAHETQRMGADGPQLQSHAPAGIKDRHDPGPTATEFMGSPSPIAPVVPSTKSITSPFGALNLKPGTAPLSPSRAPAPLAIVGGGSLKINSPDKAISPSRPPPTTLLAAIDANAPKLPTKDASFVPVPVPMPSPAVPSSQQRVAVAAPPTAPAAPAAPAAPSSRPNTAPKAFSPPAGGPPASYERAFRQWSSPNITTTDASSQGSAGPVTFQVYTAQDISAGRAPMRSIPALPREEKKASLAARIGMVAVGGVIVLLTAAAVIAVSTDDPKPPPPRATEAFPPPPSVTSVAAPVPTSISIGDPVDDSVDDSVDELPATPVNTTTATPATAAPPKPKPKPTTPAAPASLKGMAPPPNPYGK